MLVVLSALSKLIPEPYERMSLEDDEASPRKPSLLEEPGFCVACAEDGGIAKFAPAPVLGEGTVLSSLLDVLVPPVKLGVSSRMAALLFEALETANDDPSSLAVTTGALFSMLNGVGVLFSPSPASASPRPGGSGAKTLCTPMPGAAVEPEEIAASTFG